MRIRKQYKRSTLIPQDTSGRSALFLSAIVFADNVTRNDRGIIDESKRRKQRGWISTETLNFKKGWREFMKNGTEILRNEADCSRSSSKHHPSANHIED